jgi:hypothetical protein
MGCSERLDATDIAIGETGRRTSLRVALGEEPIVRHYVVKHLLNH